MHISAKMFQRSKKTFWQHIIYSWQINILIGMSYPIIFEPHAIITSSDTLKTIHSLFSYSETLKNC